MLVPILIALCAVALGLAFGLAPPRLHRVVGPLRTFALTAALAVAGTHLLPEAFSELGAEGIAVFALGLALPSFTRIGRALVGPDREHAHDGALEFGYVGLVVHHVADGMGLGAYGAHSGERHLDVLLALAVHTVPLVAVITLAYRARGGIKSACARSAGLALASAVGVVISTNVSEEASHHFSAWVAAGVAGLLVHVVTHDLERDLPTTTGGRAIDLVAAVAGVVITVAASAGHEASHEGGSLASGASRLADITIYLATPLLLGLAAASTFELWNADRAPSRSGWLGLLSLERAVALREEPAPAKELGPASGFVVLLFASALGFDALSLGVWLSGALEPLRILLVVVLAFVAARLLGGAPKAPPPERGEQGSWFAVFGALVSRTTPWLVTSIALAAMLDASLAEGSLAQAASPLTLAAIVIVLSLPVQVDAAAAAPVLAVLVTKGLPASVAVAVWVVIAAPGERALLALARGSARVVVTALGSTAVLGFAVFFAMEALPLRWSPPPLGPSVERLGSLAALLLAIPVIGAIWKQGLRGWLSGVFLHDHPHEHAH